MAAQSSLPQINLVIRGKNILYIVTAITASVNVLTLAYAKHSN